VQFGGRGKRSGRGFASAGGAAGGVGEFEVVSGRNVGGRSIWDDAVRARLAGDGAAIRLAIF
jgi:hypothetical protein